MKNFVLLYPPFTFKEHVLVQPPLPIAHLHSVLEEAKVGNVEAVDLDLEFDHSTRSIDYFLDQAVKRLERLEPTAICISCKSAQFPFSILFTRKYKALHPETKVIMGGWMPTLAPDSALQLSGCDAVVRGEGERALPNLLRRIDDKGWNIDGVSYVSSAGGDIVHNPNSVLLSQKELDLLPYPNFESLPPLQKYQPRFRNAYLTIETSRGCPNHRCIFCWNSTKYCDTSWRARSPERVVNEIEFMVNKYAANYFSFADDCFGADPHWLDEFISLMNTRMDPDQIMYGCPMRIDHLNEETLERLRKTGLTRLFHGIESGSPRMWKTLGKNLDSGVTEERIIRIVKKEIELGIDPQMSVMIGLPEETEEDIDKTLTLCRHLADVGAHFAVHLLNPYEGTKVCDSHPESIKPFDMYGELNEIDNFDTDFRKVFAEHMADLSIRLPDFKWIQPLTPYDVFKRKYFELRQITSLGLPFFYRGPGV